MFTYTGVALDGIGRVAHVKSIKFIENYLDFQLYSKEMRSNRTMTTTTTKTTVKARKRSYKKQRQKDKKKRQN